MKIFKSGMKVLGIIALICVLTLSFSPSKAFAEGERILEVSGNAVMVDRDPGDAQTCNYEILESIDLTEGQSGTLLNFSECCGDELRGELLLEASLEGDIFDVSSTAKLFEGRNCGGNDLEDEEGQRANVRDQELVPLKISLENGGGLSGENVDFDLRLRSILPTR